MPRKTSTPNPPILSEQEKTNVFAIEWWPIDRPKPYAKNARKISDRAVSKVAASLKEFGWRQPIVCEPDDTILVGHTRLLAAQSLDLALVPVHVAHGLTAAQRKAYRLMDNRSHEEATWDLGILAGEFTELQGLNLDLSLTGFESMQIDGLLNGIKPEWKGMPDFKQDDLMPWQTVKVHFEKKADRIAFGKLIGQTITDSTKFVWHPKAKEAKVADKAYSTPKPTDPRYPVYIISKGRWQTRLTSKALEAMHVPYRIVIEPQEREEYAAVLDPAKILVLPFSNLGQGSIPARNWVWEHSVSEGHARHWILDDNISQFLRLHNNLRIQMKTGAAFLAAEDFAERYTNVALAGFNYRFLAKRKQKLPPFVANTRIYSCILIKNDIPYRWRGRYNEDTDLSLRALKDGWCTVQFNAFLSWKMETMKMKGGNTDELYKGDGRTKMAESLRDQHPDVVTITRKWGRWQHQVDYRPFKANKFIPKPGLEVSEDPNNYGMELIKHVK